jgi:hypothetical protein
VVLAHYFEKQNVKWEGKTVVELGSGVGALGLLVAKQGAAKCILTDLPSCCDLLRKNAAENGEPANADIQPLTWGEPIPLCIIEQPIDVILGTDLLLPYAPQLFGPLCNTINGLLSSGSKGAYALIAYEERFDCSDFFTHVANCGMGVEWVPNDELSTKYQDPGRIHVFRLRLST